MKKIVCLLLCIILCGCSNLNNINSQLDEVFNNKIETIRQNNFSSFIDYYLPSDLYEIENNKTSFVFEYNGSKLVADINISNIINGEYYKNSVIFNEGFFDANKQIYTTSGEYTDVLDNNHPYSYYVFEYSNEYLLYFVSDDLIMYSYCNKNDIVPVSSRIYLLACGAIVQHSDIIASYSSKDVIDYQKAQIDLFESVLPVNGRLDDMMLEKPDNTDETVE